MTSRYPWVITRRTTRRFHRETKMRAPTACRRCGWEWRGRRLVCPACRERTDAA